MCAPGGELAIHDGKEDRIRRGKSVKHSTDSGSRGFRDSRTRCTFPLENVSDSTMGAGAALCAALLVQARNTHPYMCWWS